MAPTTRRLTRSSSGSASPPKKIRKSSPKKAAVAAPKGRRRETKAQPRIDESLTTFKPSSSSTAAAAHGEDEMKKKLSQDGVDGEVQMQVQLKSSGIKQGIRPYEIREATASSSHHPPPAFASPFTTRIDLNKSTTSTSTTDASQETGWSQDTTYYTSPDGTPSKLGSLLSNYNSPAVSTTSTASSDATTSTTIGGIADDEMRILDLFDINHLFGPCRGMSRSERYYRGLRYKVEPPPPVQILEILNAHKNDKDYELQWESCIWDRHDMGLRGRKK